MIFNFFLSIRRCTYQKQFRLMLPLSKINVCAWSTANVILRKHFSLICNILVNPVSTLQPCLYSATLSPCERFLKNGNTIRRLRLLTFLNPEPAKVLTVAWTANEVSFSEVSFNKVSFSEVSFNEVSFNEVSFNGVSFIEMSFNEVSLFRNRSLKSIDQRWACDCAVFLLRYC